MDSVNEFVIEWIRGQKVASLTIPSNTRMKTKIVKLASEHDEVDYIENKDGSIFAHCPVDWVSIRPARKPTPLTEEQKEAKRQILASIRKR